MSVVPFLTDTVVVNYFAAGDYDSSGRYVKGTATSTTYSSCVLPASPEEIQRLPEGFRSQKVLKMYFDFGTDITLLVNNDEANPSEIEFEGETYAIISSERYNKIIPHWCVYVVEKNPT